MEFAQSIIAKYPGIPSGGPFPPLIPADLFLLVNQNSAINHFWDIVGAFLSFVVKDVTHRTNIIVAWRFLNECPDLVVRAQLEAEQQPPPVLILLNIIL